MTAAQPPGTPAGDGQETVLPASLLAGRYRIERVIGEGAFGRVYLALDSRLRRNVAVKELLASRHTTDSATYERYLERFQREARATGMIQHPNVVTVYDLHVDADGNHYLVMEYVDGTNLRDLLAQVGTLPEARAVAIAVDVARALEAVHEGGIVHREREAGERDDHAPGGGQADGLRHRAGRGGEPTHADRRRAPRHAALHESGAGIGAGVPRRAERPVRAGAGAVRDGGGGGGRCGWCGRTPRRRWWGWWSG